MVGTFGFAEIISVMRYQRYEVVKTKIERVIPKLSEVFKYWKTIIRSGLIGTLIGAIPGVGEDIAAWVSYDFAKEEQDLRKRRSLARDQSRDSSLQKPETMLAFQEQLFLCLLLLYLVQHPLQFF